MDPKLEEYLKNKYGEDYEGTAKQNYDDAVSTNRVAGAFASLGDVIAGRGAGASDGYFQNLNQQAKTNTIGKLADDQKDFMAKSAFENQQKEAQTKQAAFDPNSSQSVSFRKMMERSFPDVAKSYGDAWANVSAGDQENIFKPLQLKEQIESRKQQAQILAGDKRDLREQRAQERQEKIDTKREERDLALAVPGFSRTGEVLPKTEEAAKFRKATAVSEQLKSKLERMKELVKTKGSFEWGGDAGTEMESLATEIQLLGKSPELYELGVLAGPDLSLLQKITADPASMSSLFTKDSSRLKQIDSQLSSIQNKIDATAKSLGYAKQGKNEDKKTIVKTQTNQKTGQKRIVYSDGSVEIINSVAGGM